MPSLQQLRYLVALADHRHFRRAAEACHVTQPTLSAQVRALEARLNAPLIERNRGGVVLSPTGVEITRKARIVLREVAEIEALARQATAPLAATINVGVVHTLGSYLLPLIVPALRETHPALKFYVREGLPARLTDALAEGRVDLLFYPLPVRGPDIETTPLFREPLLIAAPPDHRVARAARVDPRDLAGETVMTLEPGHKLYDQVRALCEETGAILSHDYEGTSLDTLRQMVAMGMGLSLLPALYVRSEVTKQTQVVARRFDGHAPTRTIGMVWRKGTVRDEEFRALASAIRGILRSAAPEVSVLGA
ncbi:hydrogen peroxide-inducible genes activator [Oceanibium sediminis]|uniref:hydrogen peroxide-inducible genes activator n=1 Tax=Oceanibium sediminis TaxID=2026339 RepID=UPI000DD3A67D|nr:hydrogen peroxide-inducible genes activator [Oceanibium sediminis]